MLVAAGPARQRGLMRARGVVAAIQKLKHRTLGPRGEGSGGALSPGKAVARLMAGCSARADAEARRLRLGECVIGWQVARARVARIS